MWILYKDALDGNAMINTDNLTSMLVRSNKIEFIKNRVDEYVYLEKGLAETVFNRVVTAIQQGDKICDIRDFQINL